MRYLATLKKPSPVTSSQCDTRVWLRVFSYRLDDWSCSTRASWSARQCSYLCQEETRRPDRVLQRCKYCRLAVVCRLFPNKKHAIWAIACRFFASESAAWCFSYMLCAFSNKKLCFLCRWIELNCVCAVQLDKRMLIKLWRARGELHLKFYRIRGQEGTLWYLQ